MISSVCRLPFIRVSTSPLRASATAAAAEAWLCSVSTRRYVGDVLAERLRPARGCGRRPHQHRHDQVALGRLERAEQRVRVARVRHGAGDRRQRLAALQQTHEHVVAADDELGPLEFCGNAPCARAPRPSTVPRSTTLARGLDRRSRTARDAALGCFSQHRDRRAHQVAHADHAVELELLRHDPRARPGQAPLQHAGDDRLGRDRVDAQMSLATAPAPCCYVERHHVAGDQQQRLDLVLPQQRARR